MRAKPRNRARAQTSDTGLLAVTVIDGDDCGPEGQALNGVPDGMGEKRGGKALEGWMCER